MYGYPSPARRELSISGRQNASADGPSLIDFVSFYGTLWLIANDVIIGTSLMTFLCENDVLLANGIMRIIEVRRASLLLLQPLNSVVGANDQQSAMAVTVAQRLARRH